MANLTIRDVSESLHGWLKAGTERHRRSVNKEVIEPLERAQQGMPEPARESPESRMAAIMAISRRSSALPVCDLRPEDDILGYDDEGLPESLWSLTRQR